MKISTAEVVCFTLVSSSSKLPVSFLSSLPLFLNHELCVVKL